MRSQVLALNTSVTACSWNPISTNSAPLRMWVVICQNANACVRVRAEMTFGPTWLIVRPQVTTATTPDAWTSSAGR